MFRVLYHFGKKNYKMLLAGFLFLNKNFRYKVIKNVNVYISIFNKVKIY